ncbi:hypothetical protein [Acetobacterium tundrae]|uniref:Uncharacterized protein n=1 Tax=Acetobacterium tundrae TaxID=132932 RepID=A0ABR6WH85_9FIRM|nr:hypothetical protein [Acetobacterium tundrae]MBC3795628.1 hypothetical protein [Acetobacterium tundrae]
MRITVFGASNNYLRLYQNYHGSLRMIYMQSKPNGITKADAEAQKSENLIK